jgi:hypothetical protein
MLALIICEHRFVVVIDDAADRFRAVHASSLYKREIWEQGHIPDSGILR